MWNFAKLLLNVISPHWFITFWQRRPLSSECLKLTLRSVAVKPTQCTFQFSCECVSFSFSWKTHWSKGKIMPIARNKQRFLPLVLWVSLKKFLYFQCFFTLDFLNLFQTLLLLHWMCSAPGDVAERQSSSTRVETTAGKLHCPLGL